MYNGNQEGQDVIMNFECQYFNNKSIIITTML